MAEHCTSRIKKDGPHSCADISKRVSDSFGKSGYVPVKGTLNGHPIKATLVPVGEGRHRLVISGEMRKVAGVEVGDSVELELEVDRDPNVIPMPEPFCRALKENPEAFAAFNRLAPAHQKEFLLYMNSFKRPETVEQIVERAIATLLSHHDGRYAR
jgi:hypothetical protein